MSHPDAEHHEQEIDPSPLRPYVVTRGRTQPTAGTLDLISQVVALTEPPAAGLDPEHLTIMRLCREPISLAELATYLDLPAGAISVLLGDLLEWGMVATQNPQPDSGSDDLQVLKAVRDGLKSL